jgi:hypothetical protein
MRLRRNQSDTGEVSGEAGVDKRRRREGRGLGPFSGGQLTLIIVTFAVLLLFPIGAWALTFSNVAITDPGGVNQAKVDSGLNLHAAVADPAGVNVAKVDSGKNLHAAVADPGGVNIAKVNSLGQLLVAPTPPTSMFQRSVFFSYLSEPSCTEFLPPAGMAMIVTSVNYSLQGGSRVLAGLEMFTHSDSGTTCPYSTITPFSWFDVTDLTTTGPHEITFPSGVPVAANGVLRVVWGPTAADEIGRVTITGYFVPSVQCPTTTTCI